MEYELIQNDNVDEINVFTDQISSDPVDSAANAPADSEPQEETSAEVLEVISVDELLERITASESTEEPEEITLDVESVQLMAMDSSGDPLTDFVAYVTSEDGNGLQHYWKTTPIDNYTVTETLLLLIFVVYFFHFCFDVIRRWI